MGLARDLTGVLFLYVDDEFSLFGRSPRRCIKSTGIFDSDGLNSARDASRNGKAPNRRH